MPGSLQYAVNYWNNFPKSKNVVTAGTANMKIDNLFKKKVSWKNVIDQTDISRIDY